MQSPAVKTPATKKSAGGAATNKSSGKKLVQARLPFKIIAPGIATAAAGSLAVPKETTDETAKDGRKRKLSFDGEQNETDQNAADALRERSASKENLTVSAKKKKIATDDVDDIILLDDDDIAEEEEDEPHKLEEDAEKVDEEKTAQTKKDDQTPKNKNKLKATKASSTSKVSLPHTPKQKAVATKKTETPKSKEVKDKKPETPKTKEIKGKKVGTPSAMNSPQTPQTKEVKGKNTNTPKGTNKAKTDTPNSTKAKKANTPGSAKNKSNDAKASGSVTKVQIKLPLGSAKVHKRRKSKLSLDAAAAEVVVSSDENEANPVKKLKIDSASKKHKNKEVAADKVNNFDADKMSITSLDDSSTTESEVNSNVLVLEIGGNEETDVVPDSELDSRCSSITVTSKDTASKRASPAKDIETVVDETKNAESLKQKDTVEEDVETTPMKGELETQKDAPESASKTKENVLIAKAKVDLNKAKVENCEKNEITEKAEATDNKQQKIVDEKSADSSIVIKSSSSDSDASATHNESKSNAEQSSTKIIGTPKNIKEDANKSIKKALTPKQVKLMEQRRKAREEKERKLQEERLQKQREKEAKELERKKEREEREEQRRKEREEKDEQKRKEREERDEAKRKEREEKERKRLAEQEVKNEEKRKRNEAKEEELRKKEEERKRKEEADLKAKKVAEAFQKFFKTKRTSNGGDGDAAQQQANDSKSLAFRPFEVKGDMKMAPICRKQISQERRAQLDECMGGGDTNVEAVIGKQDLYLAELKCGKIIPGIWRRISVDTKISDDDVQIIDDDLDRAGQAIVEETHAPIEHFRTKFYKFHENRRPPYYGTWRKRTNVIRPRRPFVQDTKFFDYEVDSDLEWEEEEPGESLDGSDDEKEKESEDDDYEVDNEWFVPHGHLSEEEMQNEDDDANTREAQKAKLQVLQKEFAQEMKKKTEKIKPRLIGCIWTDENGKQPSLCPKIIWDTLNNRAMLCEAPPLLEDPEVPEKLEVGSPPNEKTVEKIKPIKITEAMLNDLVRLVHGNHHSKNFLIKEFIAYLEASEESIKNGETRGPLKSLVREKIDEFAEWTITESTKVSQSNKKKNKKHLCWVVSADVLKRMQLESLELHNTWKYTLQPKPGPERSSTKPDKEVSADADLKETTEIADGVVKKIESKSTPKTAKKIKTKQEGDQQKVAKVKTNAEITKFTKVLSSKTNTHKSPKSSDTSTQAKKDSKSQPRDDAKTTAATTPTATATTTPTATATTTPTATVTTEPVTAKPKKRVPLLMSVARGQQISQPTKNALISEFLKKTNAEKAEDANKNSSDAQSSSTSAVANSEVVEID